MELLIKGEKGKIIGGYKKKNGKCYFIFKSKIIDCWGKPGFAEQLFRFEKDMAIWCGGLVETARERFGKCKVGETWRYNNRPFIKLNKKEIEQAISNKKYSKWIMEDDFEREKWENIR